MDRSYILEDRNNELCGLRPFNIYRESAQKNYKTRNVAKLEEDIGYTFMDRQIVITALTHPSYVNMKKRDKLASYERLEFLGDSVLGLIVTADLYLRFPNISATQLIGISSEATCNNLLCELSKELKLGDYLIEFHNRLPQIVGNKILADLYESMVGAVFLDGGYDSCQAYVLKTINRKVKSLIKKYDRKKVLRLNQNLGGTHTLKEASIIRIQDIRFGNLRTNIDQIENHIQYKFRNIEFLSVFFLKLSKKENMSSLNSNTLRKMTFVGAQLIKMVLSKYCFMRYPKLLQDGLTNKVVKLIQNKSIASKIKKLGLDECFYTYDLKDNDGLFTEIFKSLAALIYIDGGFDEAEKFILQNIVYTKN